MKFGLAIVTFVLTLIFSYVAIQNNKMAREITAREFGLKKIDKKANDDNKSKKLQKIILLELNIF